ncbi:helix-turn-helix transcriptional regulator [Haloarchaeobius litoreus]|uniref:Helix-turn-helix transcriptional regulator n=1 Tax=Haloarchaeobius litoreus TaxID=755306 RepID=A0ABD6DH68_9EURY|nr:MarR family transcriptional regulator [Haloarchaeobius litoreus]
MERGTIPHGSDDGSVGDVAYLARSPHRIPTLVLLTERPRSRSELCELVNVSSSTIRRTMGEFEDRLWVRKDGYKYVATRLGEAVAEGVDELLDRLGTERKLRDVWHWLPDEVTALPVESWSELTVTVAGPDCPYQPVNRFESLLGATDTLRCIRPEVALMEPCFDLLCRLVDDGLDVTIIDRLNCHTYFYSTYPERSTELLERENFSVLEHDELPPYGTTLLDDRVAISCYERESGTVQALIDTAHPAVREWAREVYERHSADARPFEPAPLPG